MDKLTLADIYCGAGGFSEGFRQQGFKIIYGIDKWKPAIDTFNYNFGLSCFPCDVLDYESSDELIDDIPDTDVIIGSPPCVSFSSSNKSGKADKSMGLRLIKVFLKIIVIKKNKPNSMLKAWIMENVRNSTSHLKNTYTYKELHLTKWARKMGISPYKVAINLKAIRYNINSADFGVPQLRERVFIGEVVQGRKKIEPIKTHQASKGNENLLPRHITLGYILSSLPKPNSDKMQNIITDPLYPRIKIAQEKLTDQFYDTGLYACEWKESKYLKINHPYMGRMSFPDNVDYPSRTVTATKIGTSREAIIFCSDRSRIGDGEYRTATVREAATLMGFPITYQFLGSENNKWKLVGNAVCPPVSRAFAKKILEDLGLETTNEPKTVGLKHLDEVQNLNTYKKNQFNNPPKRNKKSRFRKHPFKYGNMTVTLSNYDIKKNKGNKKTRWFTSVQYGTGDGFIIQKFPDGYYETLKPIITTFNNGSSFLDSVNNGFSNRVPKSPLLQHLYESRSSQGDYLGPTELVEEVADMIEKTHNDEFFADREKKIFKKVVIPKKQVMALYAINEICSIANGGGNINE